MNRNRKIKNWNKNWTKPYWFSFGFGGSETESNRTKLNPFTLYECMPVMFLLWNFVAKFETKPRALSRSILGSIREDILLVIKESFGKVYLFVFFLNGYSDHLSLQLRLLIEYNWFIWSCIRTTTFPHSHFPHFLIISLLMQTSFLNSILKKSRFIKQKKP